MKWLGTILQYLDRAVKSNTGISSLSLITVGIGVMSVIMLAVICICMLIEVISTHTITTSLDGYAAIIGAIAGLIAAAGMPKALNNYSENRYNNDNNDDA